MLTRVMVGGIVGRVKVEEWWDPPGFWDRREARRPKNPGHEPLGIW